MMSLEEDHVSHLQKGPASGFFPERFTYSRYSKIFQPGRGAKGFFPAWALGDDLLLPHGDVAQGVYALGLMTLKWCFKAKPLTLTCQIRHGKASLRTSPTLAVGLLLNKGVKFKLKAFLMNSLRTLEPPQLVTSWKRCRAQQLLRWSTETAKLPSAMRQLQRASPRLCKLLSESITHLSLFWARCNIPLVWGFFSATLQKEDRATLGCHFSSKMLRGLLAPGGEQTCTVQRGKLGAGCSAATKGRTKHKG